MALADRLGRTLGELDAMPMDEVTAWLAYFEILREEAKRKRHGA